MVSTEAADRFLQPSLSHLNDPFRLAFAIDGGIELWQTFTVAGNALAQCTKNQPICQLFLHTLMARCTYKIHIYIFHF